MIGASHLSEKAKELEMAAKEKREEYIAGNHYDMMSEYARVVKGIKTPLEEKIEEAKKEKGISSEEPSGEISKDTESASGTSEIPEEKKSAPPVPDEDEILEFDPVDEEGGEEK